MKQLSIFIALLITILCYQTTNVYSQLTSVADNNYKKISSGAVLQMMVKFNANRKNGVYKNCSFTFSAKQLLSFLKATPSPAPNTIDSLILIFGEDSKHELQLILSGIDNQDNFIYVANSDTFMLGPCIGHLENVVDNNSASRLSFNDRIDNIIPVDDGSTTCAKSIVSNFKLTDFQKDLTSYLKISANSVKQYLTDGATDSVKFFLAENADKSMTVVITLLDAAGNNIYDVFGGNNKVMENFTPCPTCFAFATTKLRHDYRYARYLNRHRNVYTHHLNQQNTKVPILKKQNVKKN